MYHFKTVGRQDKKKNAFERSLLFDDKYSKNVNIVK